LARIRTPHVGGEHSIAEALMAKNEKSSKKTAKLAGKVLASKSSSKTAKTLAASVLTQAPDKKKKKK
jgi:hypothetical protein